MIKRVWADMLASQGANIYWELGPELDPSSIDIQCAHNATDETWTTIATLTADEWMYHDTVVREFGQRSDIWYRIVITYSDGSIESSPGVVGGSGMPKRDWLIGQEIIRNQLLQFVKGSGTRGLLFKRKHWGAVCPACADYDTQVAGSPICPTCHGTGKDGGYYAGVMAWAELSEVAKKLNLSGPGIDQEVTIQAKFIAVPEPEARDIWVDLATGIRYMIGVDGRAVQVAAQIRGRPLIVVAQMVPIPKSDTTYGLTTDRPAAGPQAGPYSLPNQHQVQRPNPYGEY